MWPFPYLVYKHLYFPSSSSTPATCVTSLSKPQNIFLIEFAEQPKSPRMLSHPSTSSTGTPHIYRLSNFLTLHWGSNQILQVSWPHVCHFHRYQLSTLIILPKHIFVIMWSHPPPHPIHVSREPGRRWYPNYPITWWHFSTSWIRSKDFTASPILRAWTIDNWHSLFGGK